jgi:nucleoside-diphosphate-sugar epimerase
MVGSALVNVLQTRGGRNPITRNRAELDLTQQAQVRDFFASERIERVYLAAARVGGIKANNENPADFIRVNLQIQTNVIDAAYRSGVSRLLFLGSSCIYPRLAEQPMTEAALMTGPLEPTNEAYAIAKIAGIKMCESYRRQHGCDFRSVMPTNLYGPRDNFDLESSHVLPALLRRFHQAAVAGDGVVKVWGSGRPRREFMHVDDMAAACCHLMELREEDYWSAVSDRCSHVNIGTGADISIADLATLIADITGFAGAVEFDASQPDGTPRKLLDVGRLRGLGWEARIGLREGILGTYAWMKRHWRDITTA